MSFSSQRKQQFKLRRLGRRRTLDSSSFADRQERVPGFSQTALAALRVLIVGAGGIGSNVAYGLVRKGCGTLLMCDGDTVDETNLNRQFFRARDVGRNKAVRLQRNLGPFATPHTLVEAWPLNFEEVLDKEPELDFDVMVFAADRPATRLTACRYLLERQKPGVFTAVSRDGDNGYVFVQESGGACLGCFLGDKLQPAAPGERAPCPDVAAILDPLLVVTGLTLLAVDSLAMPRKRRWNFRMLSMAGHFPERLAVVERRPDCTVCGSQGTGAEGTTAKEALL